ncbi:MAG: CHC2 zinc finger domain-containing protein [Acidobacteriota bacterium]|nr:CHC2 zinc finger domain-containing protein [Acidobacteriota bacterium]
MIPQGFDFQHLKSYVSIEMVLAAKGLLPFLRKKGGRIIGPCPLHHGDNPHAFVVTLTKDLWHCFTRCDAGGDVVELVRRLDALTYPQAAAYLATLAGVSPKPPAPPPKKPAPLPRFNPVYLYPYIPFLINKGIHHETAARFGIGSLRGPRSYQNSVLVPLHDIKGNPLGYATRFIKGYSSYQTMGKWQFPNGIAKKELLFNFHRCRPHLGDCLVVVECPWGVLRLTQLDIPAVALLGIHLSDFQRALLALVPRVILLMDGDQAGRNATDRIYDVLSPFTDVRRVKLPPDTDPDDHTGIRLRAMLEPFLP